MATEQQQIGDFKVIKKLGQGGMGEVFLAHQISLDRQVALKVMAKQFCTQENFVKRFIREAQTMAKLDHPNIVRGYAVGKSDDGSLYLAMELIKGKSMQDWMNEKGKLSIGDALHTTLLVADALKHAHEINLIHRDIKPDNILVTDKGIVKVSDMGLAKVTDEDMSMTQSGTGLGTPYYMPPEQATNAKHVDHRSDIYALGCTLYHFLTGKLPFGGSSAVELIMSKQKGIFTRAKSVNPEIPERLDLMIDKMIAKDPAHRYQNCDELIRDLNSLSMANPALSFIAGAVATNPAARSASPSAQTAPRMAAVTGGDAPMKSAPSGASSATQEGIWFVVMKGQDGVPKKIKMTIAQAKQLLQQGKIDLATKACKTAQGEYLPMAQIPEFRSQTAAKMQRNDTTKKNEEFAKLYKAVDRQQRWKPFVKFFGNLFSGIKGAASLVIYLAILGAVGLGIAIVASNWNNLDALKNKALGMIGQKPAATAPAAPPQQPPANTGTPQQ